MGDYKLNDKQLRGIQLVGKAIMKRYPFIKSVEPIPNQEEYDSMLFLNVVMDYQEFADNYKYFLQRFKYSKLSSSTISSYMYKDKELTQNEGLLEEIRDIRKDIEENLTLMYERLPEEFISTWTPKWDWVDKPQKPLPRTLGIAEYIDTQEPEEL